MKKSKVLLDFIKLSVGEKIAFYRSIIDHLTDSTLFATPDVTIAELNTHVTTLETDYVAAMGGDHALLVTRNHSENSADDVFRKTAMYVDRIANGDPAVILKSGFQVSKQPEPSAKDTFIAEAGKNPCEVVLRRKAQPEAKSYLWQFVVGAEPANDKLWLLAGASTQSKFIIKGLESGCKCWFRVAAITSKGLDPWSDPVMRVVP